jgi:fatty-acyl-CoA synthase
MAIRRVLDAALAAEGLEARVVEVVEDKKRGLTAKLAPKAEADRVAQVLGNFATAWDWQG